MTAEQMKEIHDKLDALILEVRTIRLDAQRKGGIIEQLDKRIEALEHEGRAAE